MSGDTLAQGVKHLLEKLTPIPGRSARAQRMQAIQECILALAQGENITTSGGLRKGLGQGGLRLDGKAGQGALIKRGRFVVTYRGDVSRLYVSPGAVGIVNVEDPQRVLPEYPEYDGATLPEKGWMKIGAAGGGMEIEVGAMYEVVCNMDSMRVLVRKEESGASDEEDEDTPPELVLATLSWKAAGDGYALDAFEQLWESDILWPASGSSSSSYISSEESENLGSSKDTAVVPSPHSTTGYIAFAAVEATGVWFEDMMLVPVDGRRVFRVPLDERYADAIEGDLAVVMGTGSDGKPVKARLDGREIEVRLSLFRSRRPELVALRITAIRKGFRHWRMEEKTREEFLANEAWLQRRKG